MVITGLQTPRLKRLAEIVSAQAIAQQEKYDDDDQYDEGEGGIPEIDETPEIEAAA
jgi:myosin V